MKNTDAEQRLFNRLDKAYCVLLQEKSPDKITVTELTKQADMARATFYLHFDSMEQFHLQCVSRLLSLCLRQCTAWFCAGREGIQQACRRSRFMLTPTDCALIEKLILTDGFLDYFSVLHFSDTHTAMRIFCPQWTDGFIEENRGALSVFFAGFLASTLPCLPNYNSRAMCTQMAYIFEIWEYFFPDRKPGT